jgi:hypothetical protein
VLEASVPRGAEFVAIGKPGDVMTGGSWQMGFSVDSVELDTSAVTGAGKAEIPDADWKRTVQEAARGADLILVVPLDYAGTRWGVQTIRGSGYLGKTVFIMPESVGTSWEGEWEKARAAYARKNFALPPYQKAGMLFMMSDDGTMAAGYSLLANLGRAFRVRRVLRQLGVRE